LGVLALSSLVAIAAIGVATGDEKKAEQKPAKAISTTGEIIDLGCYMGHSATGEKHASCATKCIAGGMPMGLLTDKGHLYVLTPPHENQDAYNKCKTLAGTQVEVTGEVNERSGMKSIEVTAVAPAPAAPAKKS
jgi:hypothetical protein